LIFSPPGWQPGSSLSHLAAGNQLMSPGLAPGLAIRQPSNVELGMLEDMGWQVTYPVPLNRLPADTPSNLIPGERLQPGQVITSPNGRFRFAMQTDGNLVLYAPWGAIWASGTNGRTVTTAVMQGDGNLVLYNGTQPVWHSQTHGNAGAFLQVQDDGNVVIYAWDGQAYGRALWSTGTAGAGSVDYKWVESLYRDLLGRSSDPQGLKDWCTQLWKGASPSQIVNGFLRSAEYTRRYATSLYNTLLDRGPDEGGLNNWANALARGDSIQNVILGFCASEEFFNKYGRNNGRFVEALYNRLLGRGSDPGGYANWVGALNRGVSRVDIVRGFLGSEEYRGRCVDGFYRTYLHRDPDAGGRAHWVRYLGNGASLQDTIRGFVTSDEYRNHTAQ
jgi:hypothetical protein